MNSTRLDIIAITSSSVCLFHCLALPVLTSVIPMFSAFSDTEWLHKVLVLIAAPSAFFAFLQTHKAETRKIFGIFAFLGTLTLIIAAFIPALHESEVLLTTLGAITLAGAHLFRWQHH